MNPDPLKTLTDAMGEPAPPPEFDRVVMARITRLAGAEPRLTTPRRAARTRESPTPAWLDVPAWLGSVVGLAVFFGSWIGGHLAGDGLARILTSPGAAAAMMSSMPPGAPALAGLAIGAALFVASLFATDRVRPETVSHEG